MLARAPVGLCCGMTSVTGGDAGGDDAFQRSRAHRRGVRKASLDLEEAIARPAGQDAGKWSTEMAERYGSLIEAFRYHVQQSEGPEGLLPEIVATAPRLAHAVEKVKEEHRSLLVDMDRLHAGVQSGGFRDVEAMRREALDLLQALAAHRQRGSDLIYEAYLVDVEGGESG
jgi:hypothetical protein